LAGFAQAKRLALLPLLNNFRPHFYLAGGIGLALQIGHRRYELEESGLF